MISDFLLPQSRLNFLSLLSEKPEELLNSRVPKTAVIYFEYKKFEKEYQTKKYLLNQIVKKLLSIEKALYLDYALLFLFDNITNYLIYTQDALQIMHINKILGSQ